MKKTVLAALAAGSAVIAMPALAQTASGTVTVTGTVTGKCAAIPDLDDSINAGELALADGTVDSAFSANVGGLTRTFRVNCTGVNPSLSVNTTPMVAAVTADPGYSNTVHYTSTLVADQADGGTTTVVDTSNTAGATTSPLGVGERLANQAVNLTLTISNGNTTTPGALLVAGSYSGAVVITVTP